MIIVPGGYGFYPWGYGGVRSRRVLRRLLRSVIRPGYGGYGGLRPLRWRPSYSTPNDDDDGAVRIKVKPREASVYVDGYLRRPRGRLRRRVSAPAPRIGAASARNPRSAVRARLTVDAIDPNADHHPPEAAAHSPRGARAVAVVQTFRPGAQILKVRAPFPCRPPIDRHAGRHHAEAGAWRRPAR